MFESVITIRIVAICVCAILLGIPMNNDAKDEAYSAEAYLDGAAGDETQFRTLKIGVEGDDVLRLKKRMQELGFFSSDATLTAKYNITMEYKVKQYQNAIGTKATGIATPELQAVIFSEGGNLPTPTPVPTINYIMIDGVSYRVLQFGAKGDDVLRLKRRLQELGFFTTDAMLSDNYNVTMVNKVKQYQRALGLPATGTASPDLQAKINSDNGGLATPTPAPTINWVIMNGTAYRNLRIGDEGEDVLRLKQCMQELGLFSIDAKLTDQYNITMAHRVQLLQKRLGEQTTGVSTPEFQSAIFSKHISEPVLSPASFSSSLSEPSYTSTPEPKAESVSPPATDSPITPETCYRTLQCGTSGEDVKLFKQRLQELGYFSQNADISQEYNITTAYKVRQYQNDLGEKATGKATPELQITAFSNYGGLATPVPLSLPSLPELTNDGFLPSENEVFIYENADVGQWLYISNTLRIEITKYSRTGNRPLIWFETIIRFTDAERFVRYESLQKYKNRFNTEYPNTIAQRNNIVLAFSDDFFGYRKSHIQKEGIIINDGVLVANNPYKKNIVSYLPPLDMMALFPDGSSKVFYSCECTAKELLEMGVRDTLSFGPILLRAGQLGQQVANGEYSNKEPRCALGMIDKRYYVLITVEGRYSKSQGESLSWLALRMRDLGVQEAINLDGGNTTALVFRGQLLNKCGTFAGKTITLKGIRSVSSIMGIGQMQTPATLANE